MEPQEKERENEDEEIEQSDSCLQRPALPLDQVNLGTCEEGERQAFNYLLNVRQEANALKKRNKIKIKESERKEKQAKQLIVAVEGQQKKMEPYWINVWKKETVSNWKCVVENCKHIIAKEQQSSNIQKISLKQVPQIYGIVWMPLGKIEESIKKLSQYYYHNSEDGDSYYLWIYSLLAVHQSKAAYRVFQSLADICACVLAESTVSEASRVVSVLLIEYFSQRHLQTKIE